MHHAEGVPGTETSGGEACIVKADPQMDCERYIDDVRLVRGRWNADQLCRGATGACKRCCSFCPKPACTDRRCATGKLGDVAAV